MRHTGKGHPLKPAQRFSGQTGIITGASRGLGAAVAERLAAEGMTLGLIARTREDLHKTQLKIDEAGGRAEIFPCDLNDWDAVQNAVNKFHESFSRLDLLVTCAGAKRVGPAATFERDDALSTLGVNYLGAVGACQAALRHMKRGAQIINVSSVLGKRATPGRGAYSASKAALNAYTDALRVELATAGIIVTLVCPGRLDAEEQSQAGVLEQGVARAAKVIVNCVGRRRREVVLTPAGKVLTTLNVIAPGIVDRILGRWRRDANR